MKKQVGQEIARVFTSSKKVDGRKKEYHTSIEYFKITKITFNSIFIDEYGRKSNGTYGEREFDIHSGNSLDDPYKDYRLPELNYPRRKIII